MRGMAGERAVGFDEHEARGIVGLLDDIEARDAGLADARTGVGERGGLEGVDALGFHVNEDMDDVHGEAGLRPASSARAAPRQTFTRAVQAARRSTVSWWVNRNRRSVL